MENKVTVEAVRHKDVRGKDLYYLRIKKGKDEMVINIGAKTYDKVKSLEIEKKLEEGLQKEDNKNKK